MNETEFVPDLHNYARVVFEVLAHKVKHWITFNETLVQVDLGVR